MENAPRVTGERFDSFMPRARQMYAAGASVGDVMRALYGVDLPAEAYVYWRSDKDYELDLGLDRVAHPWMLIGAHDPARNDEPGEWEREQEAAAFAQLPRFLPLMRIAARSKYDDYLIGYDLDELGAGRTTIFGYRGDLPPVGASLKRLGDSLLAVLHASLTDELDQLTKRHHDPELRGMDAVLDQDLAPVRARLQSIERLQREVAAKR